MENVVLVTFEAAARTYQAMSELRRLSDEEAVDVRFASIVERLPDGRFRVPEQSDNIGFTGTAVGAGAGALVGALVGPLGVPMGGAVGVAIGSVSDADNAESAEVLVSAVSRRVPPGGTALVADVEEPTPEVLNVVLDSMGGQVHRWSRWEVEDELAVAEEATRAAEAEARRVLRERRKAEGRETVGDQLREFKDRITDSG